MNGGADDWMTCCDADTCNVHVEYPTKDDKRESASLLLPPAKEVLGQGNVFTPVCQSFCLQGGSRSLSSGVSVWVFSVRWALSRGGLCPVGFLSGCSLSGELCPEGVSVQGDLCPAGVSVQRGSLSGESLSGKVSVRETPVR